MSIAQLIVVRRTGTEVTPAGLRIRTGLTRRRSVAWTQIAELELAQDHQASCTALLHGGGRVDLPGVPREVGRALVGAQVVRGSS